jgi:pimeloyl-ACP methyl ester carboxylesterase
MIQKQKEKEWAGDTAQHLQDPRRVHRENSAGERRHAQLRDRRHGTGRGTPGFWNFGFFMLDNGPPERIVSGREDTWIAGFVDWLEVVKGAVDPDAVAEYAAHLRRPGHLGASYAYFRTFHGDVEATIRHRETPLAMPVLAIGGEGALGQAIPDQMQMYAGDVTGAVFPCGHWVAEESPDLLLKHLLPFLD